MSEVNFHRLSARRSYNHNILIISNINMKSLREKFQMLLVIIQSKTDILFVAEAKLDFFFLRISLIYIFLLLHIELREMKMVKLLCFMRENVCSKPLTDEN